MCWEAISAVGTAAGAVAASIAAIFAYRALDWIKQNQTSHKYQSYVICLAALNELKEKIEELEEEAREILMFEAVGSEGLAVHKRTIIRGSLEQTRREFLRQSTLAMRLDGHIEVAITELNVELRRREVAILRDSESQSTANSNDYPKKLQAVYKWLDDGLGVNDRNRFRKKKRNRLWNAIKSLGESD